MKDIKVVNVIVGVIALALIILFVFEFIDLNKRVTFLEKANIPVAQPVIAISPTASASPTLGPIGPVRPTATQAPATVRKPLVK